MLDLLTQSPILFLLSAISLVVAVTVHEFSHALAADRLGDPTPSLQGRVTLNPLSHLDPIGTLMLLLAGFGWGKPVQFDPFNLKNPQRDAAIISVVGPLSNIVMAVLGAAVYHLSGNSVFFVPFIQINVVLAVLNLIPVHPFDGFKVVGGLLPEDRAYEWYSLQRYWWLFLMLLIIPVGGASMLDQILTFFVSPLMRVLVG
jgi:Zn-dependent protease